MIGCLFLTAHSTEGLYNKKCGFWVGNAKTFTVFLGMEFRPLGIGSFIVNRTIIHCTQSFVRYTLCSKFTIHDAWDGDDDDDDDGGII